MIYYNGTVHALYIYFVESFKFVFLKFVIYIIIMGTTHRNPDVGKVYSCNFLEFQESTIIVVPANIFLLIMV